MTGPRAKPDPMRAAMEVATEAARCGMAEALFKDTEVKAAIAAAANRGRKVCAFHPSPPFDPRGTPAADKVEKWAREEGFQVGWTDLAPVMEQGIEVGQSRALVLSWDTPRLVPA